MLLAVASGTECALDITSAEREKHRGELSGIATSEFQMELAFVRGAFSRNKKKKNLQGITALIWVSLSTAS